MEYLCIKSELKDDYNRRINIINKKLSLSDDPNMKLLNDIAGTKKSTSVDPFLTLSIAPNQTNSK